MFTDHRTCSEWGHAPRSLATALVPYQLMREFPAQVQIYYTHNKKCSLIDIWYNKSKILITLKFLLVTRLRSESPLNHYTLYDTNAKHSTSTFNRREERRDSADYYKPYTSDVKDKSYDVTDSAYSTSRVNKKDYSLYGSESPRNRTASPITTKHLGNGPRLDINRANSPFRATSPYRATSPVGRTASPLTRRDSPLNRTGSPINRYGEFPWQTYT